jgi:hypothetical protein
VGKAKFRDVASELISRGVIFMVRAFAVVFVFGWMVATPSLAAAPADPSGQLLPAWQYYQDASLPPVAEDAADRPKYCDFILTPSVFDKARIDLGDLRLYDISTGAEIPYALRVRTNNQGTDAITAREFNRVAGPELSSELTLDLGEDPIEHNEVEVQTPRVNYRRAVLLEGSADGQAWRKLLETNLVDFVSGNQEVKDLKLDYSPSRYRYLRLRVSRDPEVDTDKKPVEIEKVIVRHAVEVPGEFVTLKAELGPREPARVGRDYGSAWIVNLGAAHMPCEKLLVDIEDDEFNRDYRIEAGGIVGADEPFQYVASDKWSRHAGDARKPLEASFIEQRAGRLKLIVTDFSNPPLKITGVQFVAPARQIVFERKAAGAGPVRLFYGNPKGEPPHYDLERTLSARITPAQVRLQLGERQINPAYVPPPLPLSERWPWAIYVVLGAASAALAGILFSLGRKAVGLHDAKAKPEEVAV